jgi:hypothetical protein
LQASAKYTPDLSLLTTWTHEKIKDKMPGARRASTTVVPTENITACNMIKQENKRISARGKTTAAVVEMIREPVKLCGEDTDDTIFSACNSPDCDELDSSTASELGEYELNYLHTLYQSNDLISSHMTGDTILPDAVAPPSLGGGMPVTIPVTAIAPSPPVSSSHTSMVVLRDSMEHDDCASSQPSTPPRTDDAPWCTEEAEAAPMVSSMAPSPAPAKPAVVGKTTGRKRKAVTNIDAAPAPPAKISRSHHYESRHAAKGGLTSDDNDDSDNESAAGSTRRCPMLDGLEIRPEDDPLGLFSRDPATLTPEEQRILKKQRRLLKNRESAQLSRHRKKMHLHSLEKQVEALKKKYDAALEEAGANGE